jgi:DNA-binding SARP family transcriptional activator
MRSLNAPPSKEIESTNGWHHVFNVRVSAPVEIQLLGGFRVLKHGSVVGFRTGGKAEALLSTLAVRRGQPVPREVVLDAVWPNVDPQMANQSLNSLGYGLNRLLGDAIGGASVLVHSDGMYRLNIEAGVAVDVDVFLRLITTGERRIAEHDEHGAAEAFAQGVDLYRGDLNGGTTVQHVVERERLRALCLMLLARLADYHFRQKDCTRSLDYAMQLLLMDPCREDAHRMAMQCHVLRGERAQALRQYRVCERILRLEFDAPPEEATRALFDQVRLDPSSL